MPSDYFLISSPDGDAGTTTQPEVLIYLIPGNPGLIVYYRDFVNHLNNILSSALDKTKYIITGRSLAGFEIDEIETQRESLLLPFNLQQQIENVHARIRTAVANTQGEDKIASEKPAKKLPVILIGHSVGAYMLLEILAKRQRGRDDGNVGVSEAEERYEIIGGINLFPTIVDIAKSPRGKVAAPFFYIPAFATIVHFLAGFLWLLLPNSILCWLIRQVTGMPDDSARTTAAFLGCRTGVEASLYLAKHELADMTEDKWDNTLWNITSNSKPDHPSLYFFWGENDRWISTETRDKVIAQRARQLDKKDAAEKAKPKMEIDSSGIPHDFCLRHSKPIAEKVAEYIEEIVKERL